MSTQKKSLKKVTKKVEPEEKPHEDTLLLDFLEELLQKTGLTGRARIEMQKRRRGFCLRESLPWEKPSFETVRAAIRDMREAHIGD